MYLILILLLVWLLLGGSYGFHSGWQGNYGYGFGGAGAVLVLILVLVLAGVL